MGDSPASVLVDPADGASLKIVTDGSDRKLDITTKVRKSDGTIVNPATEDTLALIKTTDGIKKIVDPLPAGTNNIGDVDIASALPAGDNNIGNVDLASALPAGTNNIGDVDIASALPAGDNNIGNVDIASAIPAGTNEIGKVAQGTAAALSAPWPVKNTDGTNTQPTMDAAARAGFLKVTNGTLVADVVGASTPPGASDKALVVAISPNTPPTADRSISGSLTGTGSVTLSSQGCGNMGCQILGTWVGTLVFEATIDGTTWFPTVLYQTGGAPFPILSTTVNVSGRFVVSGFAQVRVRCSSYTSGTISIYLAASIGSTVVRAAVEQSVAGSPGNSSVANLNSGATFTGVSESTLGVVGIQISFKASQACTIQLQQSLDGTNWDLNDTYTVAANTGDGRTFQAIANFARVLVTNNGGIATTYLRLGTAYCPMVECVPRSLGQKTMANSLGVVIASNQSPVSVTMASQTAIPVTISYDATAEFPAAQAFYWYTAAKYTIPTGYIFTAAFYNAFSMDNRVTARIGEMLALGTWNPNTGVYTNTTSYASPAFGAFLELEVTSAMGNVNDQAITISYTNNLGVSGRTATPVNSLKLKKQTPAGYKLMFQLQAGDTGVSSVQSVTADATNTGSVTVNGGLDLWWMELTAAAQTYLSMPGIQSMMMAGRSLSLDFSSSAGATVRRIVKCGGVLEVG